MSGPPFPPAQQIAAPFSWLYPPTAHQPAQPSHGPSLGPPYDPSHGPSYGPSHGPSHGSSHDTSYGRASQGPFYGPSQGLSYGPSHGPTHGSSYGPSHAPPHGPSHGASYVPSHGASYVPSHGSFYGYPSYGHPPHGHPYWREGPPPMNFVQCKTFLAAGLQNGGLRQVDALAHILGIGPRSNWFTNDIESFLYYNDSKHAQILSIDAEWYESNHRKITELEIGSLSVYTARAAPTKNFVDSLDSMKLCHMRIIENAHMINGRRCEGHPEDFQFGRTGFLPLSQVKEVLHNHLMKYSHAYMQPRYLQPIVVVGHAISNDVEEFKQYLGIDIEQYPVLITLDTQVMAREIGIQGPKGPNISLRDLLIHYGIEKETYLHNAGNDAGLTMIAACLLANDRYTNKLDTSQAQKDFDQLKLQIRGKYHRVYGRQCHCTRCNLPLHMAKDCKMKLLCVRCAEKQPDQAATHSLNKCLIVSKPCERYSASPKPSLYRHADTHETKDCLFH